MTPLLMRALTMKRIGYTELVANIDALPLTQLPGLLLVVVGRCVLHKVFLNDAALLRFVGKVLTACHPPTP